MSTTKLLEDRDSGNGEEAMKTSTLSTSDMIKKEVRLQTHGGARVMEERLWKKGYERRVMEEGLWGNSPRRESCAVFLPSCHEIRAVCGSEARRLLPASDSSCNLVLGSFGRVKRHTSAHFFLGS